MAASDFLQAGGALAGGVGSFVGGLFGSAASEDASKGYTQAANLIRQQSIPLQTASNQIDLTRLTQNTLQQLGTIRSSTAANGLTMSGSALDILRSSRTNAALDKSLATITGQQKITNLSSQASSYESQAASEKAQAAAQKASGGGGLLGGVLKAASFFL